MSEIIAPAWSVTGGPLVDRVGAASTTRVGGVSAAPFDTLNLGDHVGDDPDAVAENRQRLAAMLSLPSAPLWLNQVHGTRVVEADDWQPGIEADALVARAPGQVAAVLTADCLPVLLAADDGRVVAAAHAGWRGLAAGVLGETVRAMAVPPRRLLAWIGPAISQAAYEVDAPVRDAFVGRDHLATNCFAPNDAGRWQADLKLLAVIALQRAGVQRVDDVGRCTHGEPGAFFSHRRAAPCGRMASLIWRR